MKLGLPFSISAFIWMLAGALRLLQEKKINKRMYVNKALVEKGLKQVAICIPAHNEEFVIERTIKSVIKLVPLEQIYIVSDGSTDKTTQITRRHCVNVIENIPAKGKAKALVTLIEHFNLLDRYNFILFVDADTAINSQYVRRALRVFITHHDIAAISGYIFTHSERLITPSTKQFIQAYRTRLNYLLQMFLVYGQTWKRLNTAFVIPGSCSIYRTSVLKKVRIDTPGLLIEDFNLAFQIHKKRLGKIAHYPDIFSYDKEPNSIKDYWNQVKRWNIGFFQTIRVHGIWLSLFWGLLGLFIIEVFINIYYLILLPLLFILTSIFYFLPYQLNIAVLPFTSNLSIKEIIFIFFVFDYSLTVIVATRKNRLELLFYGLGFMFFRYLDSIILLSSVYKGIFQKSEGIWKPPKRK